MVKLQFFLANSIFTPIFKILVRTLQCGWGSQFDILQTGATKSVNLSCLARPCKYTLVIPSCYAVGDFVCPGTLREGSLVEDWRVEYALAKTTLFFWLSINYASNFPIILYFSYAANPPRYSSQVWRQRVWCRCSIAQYRSQRPTQALHVPNYPCHQWSNSQEKIFWVCQDSKPKLLGDSRLL